MKFLGSPHPYAIESRRGLSHADSGENMKSGTYRGAFWKMTLQDSATGWMGVAGIECESKVQSLGTWVMVVLLAVEVKVWRSCVWTEGEFYFSMLHLRTPFPTGEDKTYLYKVQLLLKDLAHVSVLHRGKYKKLDIFPPNLPLIKMF